MNEDQIIKSIINNINKKDGRLFNPRIVSNCKSKEFTKSMYVQHVSKVKGFTHELICEFSDEMDGCDYHVSKAYQLPNGDWFVFDLIEQV